MSWIQVKNLSINLNSVQGIEVDKDEKGHFVAIFFGKYTKNIDLTPDEKDRLQKRLKDFIERCQEIHGFTIK